MGGKGVRKPGRDTSQATEPRIANRIDTSVGTQERVHRKLIECDHHDERPALRFNWRGRDKSRDEHRDHQQKTPA